MVEDENIHRVFQVVPGIIHQDTGEMNRFGDPDTLTAYFLDIPGENKTMRTNVECMGNKYVLTITIEPL